MKTFEKIHTLRTSLDEVRENGKTLGFVPTMGALHEGHLSLVRRAKTENDFAACSVFINPTQFNDKKDLANYPKTLDSDAKKLKKTSCDYLFAPGVGEIYPEGESFAEPIQFGYLENILEGAIRPGHFRGVGIVVKKLFEIVKPDKAYFGEKDFQQLAIIRELTMRFFPELEIVPCPIIRENDGLAMSSRNIFLTEEERKEAPLIFTILNEIRKKTGSMSVEELKKTAIADLNRNPVIKTEYFEIVNSETLIPVADWKSEIKTRALVAVRIGKIRLIDNIEL